LLSHAEAAMQASATASRIVQISACFICLCLHC
jgi:hypothetical protein